MGNSNDRKSATLGMPHGTAAHRLRKNILFHLLKKHGENKCFKCAETIETVEDLSVEHKSPWEGISAELFWDLENIAFSHLHCNRPHRYNFRIEVEPGHAWCTKCQREKPEGEFHQNLSRWNTKSNMCKSCKSVRNAQRVR